MSNKVLYVEDEPFLSRIVSDGLKASGYEVNLITDGKKALPAFESFRPDICVLDIMLPSKDGYTIAEEIRMIDDTVPIIFLSAKSLTEDVVKGFKTGGNDYLRKPFSMDELLVRIEALLQRFAGKREAMAEQKETRFTFGTCTLDTVQQVLTTSKGLHTLSFKESALLEMLIRRKNDILERQEALLRIWNDDSYYNTRSMDVFMTHIRKLLKDEPGIQILSIRSVGYKLVC
ncbi:response regulator transcription factor [Chitinophaga agri]|uniref:Response regulator transcription factor n=1 Tax=Chitinophaga agri TaxID=2703787 RepID=A0A6B9ZP24_9BACT|nr:response regulator transcription factor [Chitinophaga agri]QHS63391.1 response regulator transcription factor [Chitinophaga agri]